MLADAYLLRDYFVLLKNPELLEISDDLKGKPFYTLKVANSTQGNYLRVVNTNTKKASVHFVSGLSQTNLFLTSGQEGEIKNMHLKKVEEQDEKGIAFRFYHKKGVPIPVVSHRSYNLIQEVEKWDNGVVYVKRKNIPLPEKIEGAYPLVFSSVSIKEMYTKSGVYVNADHPEIKAFTAEIMKGKTFSNQHELVKYVISQCASRLCYGDSELIPNASDALKKGVANCIGYTHLPAAVLRNLGVPTRNVRVYNTLPVQSAKMNGMESSGSFALWEKNRLPWVPHYILEVYYPSLGQWVSFDPQTSLKQVSLASVVLYDAVDWDMTKHRSSRPFATDQNLMILGADHFTDKRLRDQLPLLTRFESEEVTIAEGPLTSVFTKDDSDAIAGVFYQSTTGKLIPMIRDEDDPTKWSLYFSSLKIENTYYKPGDIMKLSGTGIQIVDKYGTVMSYNQFMGPEYGKIQFALDLVLYKSTLSNCKLVDSKTGLLHYAFCGDDIFVFDKHKQSPSAALKHSFNFSLHARRGVFLDISPKTAGMAPFSIKVDLAKDGKTVRMGDIEFALVKESLCH